ncbi:MAG: 50S ribosomal protein L11 methyltransferase [Gemmatimonadota bacterium]
MAEEKRWLVITIDAPSDDVHEALAAGLLAMGGSAVQEQGALLTTYLRAPDDLTSWLEHARAQLREIAGSDVWIDWRWQPDEDWSETWKRGLRPRRVGQSFVVTPSWSRPETRPGDRVIMIDPEMAFGTGEHGTTRGALRLLEQVVTPGARVLDVGTGSAILAIGAALLGAAVVVAVDNDADAILNARDNVTRNRVANVVRLEECLVDESYLVTAGSSAFDVIVANVLSGVLRPLLPAFLRAVRPDGYVILGGILEQQADDMLAACTSAGFHIIGEDLEHEWWGVLLQRPRTVAS